MKTKDKFIKVKQSDLDDIYMSMMFMQQRLELLKQKIIDVTTMLKEDKFFNKHFING